MSEYVVNFDFTTFHKGSRMVGRNGTITVETKKSIPELNSELELLENFCAGEMLKLNPKFKIFMVQVKTIEPK